MAQDDPASKVSLQERRAERERAARKQAEALLEAKSLELYAAKLAAEQALREKADSELRYRRLFESAQEGILLCDLETGKIEDANPAAGLLLGVSRPKLLGRIFWELEQLGGGAAPQSFAAEMRTHQRHCWGDWTVRASDGSPRVLELVTEVCSNGGAKLIHCYFRDVTDERRRAEEAEHVTRASALLRASAGVYMWRYDPDADEYEIDPDFSRRLSQAPPERRIPGPLMRAGVHREDAAVVDEPFQLALSQGEQGGAEYRYALERGVWRNIRSAWRGARRLPSGRWEVLGVTQDLTELTAERNRAQAGEEAKSRFLANISHELRTPMNGVLGILHLLHTADDHDDRMRLLNEAVAAGSRLSGLLNDLVDYSDLETGRLVLQREPADVAETVAAVTELMRERAKKQGLWLRLHCAPEFGMLSLDVARFRQLLFSLIANAVSFTIRGGIDVRIATYGQGDETRLRVDIEDTGVGISETARHDLFAGFVQGDNSMTRRSGGAGLGLATARRLAELMGGEIGCESREGEGSTFWIDIAAPTCHPTSEAEDEQSGWLEGLQVLVVEDNPTNRLVATRLLEQLGAQVETAENGALGVDAASRAPFDLILMDIQMPVMDGVEATRRIRALPSPACAIPILALTANVLAPQLESYREAGMNGCVAKPISPSALLLEISRLAGDQGAPASSQDGLAASA